jgi:hypothetical protein
LFARSTVLDFEGRSVRILSREDLLLVLCVHAAKHQWNQLGMVRDIAALAGLTLDWECLLEEARRLRIQRIVLISIILAHDLLQAELPAFARSHPDVDSASRLARVIALGMANSKEIHPESLAYFLLMMSLRESRLDRARMIWRLASRPNVGEWQSVALPEWLPSAYLGVRAARLAKRLTRSAIG